MQRIVYHWLIAFGFCVLPQVGLAQSLHAKPKVLLFDVFGTCVDYQGSIVREGDALNAAHGWAIDWTRVAAAWVRRQKRAIAAIRAGEASWANLDEIHRQGLAELLGRFGGKAASAWSSDELDEVNAIWHRLSPWPDTVPGLKKLRSGFVIGTLSNGNRSLLRDMATSARLPWEFYFSAEQIKHYKPDLDVYQAAVAELRVAPQDVMLVAAHRYDLEAAKSLGMMTAFVSRVGEPGGEPDGATFDFQANDFLELATKLSEE